MSMLLIVYYYNIYSTLLYRIIFPNKKNFYFVVFLQLFLLLALRDSKMGTDIGMYNSLFNYASKLSFYELISNFSFFHSLRVGEVSLAESGYVALNWFVGGFLGLPFHAFIVLLAAIHIYAIYKFLEEFSVSPLMGVMVLQAVVFTNYFYILRRMSSASFIFLAMVEMKHKRYIRSTLLLIVAVMMHRTALVMIFMLIAPMIRVTKKLYVFTLAASLCIFFAFRPVLVNIVTELAAAMEKGFNANPESIGLDHQSMLCVIFAIIFFFKANFRTFKERNYNNVLCWVFLFFTATVPISTYVYVIRQISGQLFQPILVVFVANILYEMKFATKYFRYLVIFSALVLLLAIATRNIAQLLDTGHGMSIVPYSTIFYPRSEQM